MAVCSSATRTSYAARFKAHNEKVSQLKAQIEATEQRIEEKKTNQKLLQDKLASYQESEVVQQLQQQVSHFEHQVANAKKELEDKLQQVSQLQSTKAQISAKLTAFSNRLERVEQQLAVQQDWQVSQQRVMTQNKHDILPQLHEQLTVDDGWELAVEMVLAELLSAHVVSETPTLEQVEMLTNMAFAIATTPEGVEIPANSLAAKVSHPDVQLPALNAGIIS